MRIRPVGVESFYATERQVDIMELIVASSKFVNASKNANPLPCRVTWQLQNVYTFRQSFTTEPVYSLPTTGVMLKTFNN
jgi:hypothetical protein